MAVGLRIEQTIITMPIQTIKEIDLAKLKLEARFIPYLKRIFKHLAHDAKILYLSTKSVPATNLE